jgi:hypothetical protein
MEQGKSAAVHTNPVKIEFNEQEEQAEFLFAVWSSMQNIYALRLYVGATWSLHGSSEVEAMQANLITNTAIDLIRRAEADFEATLHLPGKYPASTFPDRRPDVRDLQATSTCPNGTQSRTH